MVGQVSPWNYPLWMAIWKIGPALAAGNSVVLKPASATPLTTVRLAELAKEAGVPDGVFNVVTGPGDVVGAALAAHMDVDMISLTGDTETGKRIQALAAVNLKRVHLELGGKAPFIVCADADIEAAARGATAGALINGGQDCTAATRAYVQRDVTRRSWRGPRSCSTPCGSATRSIRTTTWDAHQRHAGRPRGRVRRA